MCLTAQGFNFTKPFPTSCSLSGRALNTPVSTSRARAGKGHIHSHTATGTTPTPGSWPGDI